MSTQYSEIELSDQEIFEYLDVALSAKTVTPDERKKLAPLMKYYAKKPKPFTACVKDNRKRFGPKTEAYCAVLKDLIVGNTKWRHGGNHTASGAAMSEATLTEIYRLDPPEGFGHWLGEMELSDIEDIINSDIAEESENPELAQDEDQLLAEMYFAAETVKETKPDGDGLYWKPVLREGMWKYSPGAGGVPKATPISIVFDGESNPANKVISMTEIKKNFEDNVVEHVTIPTSHADSVLENTGFVKKLRFGTDESGRKTLEAGFSFTEPDVKDKAERGTIANTSAGILFDYIHKESGKKFRSVLAHVALTNRPWLNGMKPFGVNASENVTVMGFAEESNDEPDESGGGDTSMSEVAYDFTSLGFASEDELKAALEERASLKASQRDRDVADLCQKWQSEGKSPALVAEAKAILMSDEGSTVLNLSEEGKSVELSASDIVKRLVDKAAGVDLTQEVVTEENLSQEETPEDEAVELSQEEKAVMAQLFFSGYTGKDAEEEAKRRVAAGTK